MWSNVVAGRSWSRICQEQELIQPANQARATYDIDDAIDRLRADYDTTPYNSMSYPPSAPGHLAAVAYLFGLETPDVSTARVLEDFPGSRQ